MLRIVFWPKSLLSFLSVEPFGPAPMTLELHGLMATLQRGSPRWLAFILTAYALPSGVNRATHVALVAPVRPKKGRGNKSKLSFS